MKTCSCCGYDYPENDTLEHKGKTYCDECFSDMEINELETQQYYYEAGLDSNGDDTWY